jgi:hypothetical protein
MIHAYLLQKQLDRDFQRFKLRHPERFQDDLCDDTEYEIIDKDESDEKL